MAEIEFERSLERMFAEAPEFSDAGAFAHRVEQKMSRGWTARRWLIGAAGVAGGLVAASQLAMSNLFQHVEAAETSAKLVTSGLSQMAPKTEWVSAFSGGGGVVWGAAGLAVLMMGFVLARVIEEI